MATITIEIPNELFARGKTPRRLLAVDPTEFDKEMRRRWEEQDALAASRAARREWKERTTKRIASVRELI